MAATLRTTAWVVTAVALLGLIAVGTVFLVRESRDYGATVVMPAASNLVEGTAVEIDGHDAGTIERISTRDGKAIVEVTVDDAFAPLPDGTTARIRWKALLGERILEVIPGPPTNADLPDGAMIEGGIAPVEVTDALAALDEPTRRDLVSLVGRLDETLAGSEQDLNRTVQTAGPALAELGTVLRGLGSDGAAVSTLVTHLNALTAIVAERRANVSDTVIQLSAATRELADRRAELRETLRELPATLAAVQTTMEKVPGATEATVPLLADLQPATERLPGVARELAPLLADLRPAVAELRPTLGAADVLLGRTPPLLDAAHVVVPQLTTTLDSARDAVAFLRPYTPEIVGFLANWGSHSANYDSNGNYTRVFSPQSGSMFTANPGVLPPGLTRHRAPLPGELVDQPWTDATGSGIR